MSDLLDRLGKAKARHWGCRGYGEAQRAHRNLGEWGTREVIYLGGMTRGREPFVLYYLGGQWTAKTDRSRGTVRKNAHKNKLGQCCSGFEC